MAEVMFPVYTGQQAMHSRYYAVRLSLPVTCHAGWGMSAGCSGDVQVQTDEVSTWITCNQAWKSSWGGGVPALHDTVTQRLPVALHRLHKQGHLSAHQQVHWPGMLEHLLPESGLFFRVRWHCKQVVVALAP